MATTDLTNPPSGNALGATVAPAWSTNPTAEGDVVNPGDRLLVQNDSVSSITVTADSYYTSGGLLLPDAGSAVPAGAAKVFRFSADQAQPSDGDYPGKVLVTYSAQADVHRAIVR